MLFTCAPHVPRAPAADTGHCQQVSDGKRSLTVDIHCHIHVPAADAMLDQAAQDAGQRRHMATNDLTAQINAQQQANLLERLTDPVLRISEMDACGVDIQAISPSPFHYNYGYAAEFARDTSRVCNDRVAEVVAAHPDRFVGMCTVPLQNAEMAVAELNRCVDEHGMRAVEISTNVDGQELTRSGLESFFARVEELDLLIFMHPIGTSFTDRMADHYFANLVGHPLESTLAVGQLVFDGYLKRYPGLKICIAHGGGYVSHYFGRFDHPYHLRDDCRVNIDEPPTAYLQKLYFDTVVFSEDQLRHLVNTWGADHIMMGTDYPYDMAETDPVGFVDRTSGLTDEQKSLVWGGNAARLLRIGEHAEA